MSVEKSLQRLHWRFSPNEKGQVNQFKPNQNDADALNDVIGWIEREKNKTLLKQQLFAKLFIVILGEYNLHYKDINFAQKEIHQILKIPIESHVEVFRNKFNTVASENAHSHLGLSKKPFYLQTDEEKEIDKKILEDNQEVFLKFINKWSIEEITESLEKQITNALNLYETK